jgi:hypothetical protein
MQPMDVGGHAEGELGQSAATASDHHVVGIGAGPRGSDTGIALRDAG